MTRVLDSLPKRLIEKLTPIAAELSSRLKNLRGNDTDVDQITISQMVDGARAPILICETSAVKPETGLHVRGRPIWELENLELAGIVWLLLTGEEGNEEDIQELNEFLEFRSRDFPIEVVDAIDGAAEADMHPMMSAATGLMGCSKFSSFSDWVTTGEKELYWESSLFDYLTAMAWLPGIVGLTFRARFDDNVESLRMMSCIRAAKQSSLARKFIQVAGLPDPFKQLEKVLNLYLVLLADHGKGNASANAGTLVGSTMANPFQSLAAAALALDGPSHGRANRDAAKFIIEQCKKGPATEANVRELISAHLANGRKIPGIGHGVLECIDPRYTAQMELATELELDSKMLLWAQLIGSIAPEFLGKKTKRCWPNVDLATGAVFDAAGFSHPEFLTVLFLWARSIGIGAQVVIDRMMGLPLIRPIAKPLSELEDLAQEPATTD